MENQNKRVILVVGHQHSSQGAENSALKMAEWAFNYPLVRKISEKLSPSVESVFLAPDVVHWKKAAIINEANRKTPADFVIEFHLNCAPQPTVNYCLAKIPRGNQVSAKAGILLVSALVKMGVKKATWGPPDMRVAGIFEADNQGDADPGWRNRGSSFLFKPNLPTILLESFFISCTDFLREMIEEENNEKLSDALAASILEFYK